MSTDKMLKLTNRILEAERNGFGIEYQNVVNDFDKLSEEDKKQLLRFLKRE